MIRDWKSEFFRLAPSSRADIVKDACGECGGSGYKLYGDTSTWRGGVGGQMMTNDVCDICWGSGDARKPWPSHRRFEALERFATKEPKE